MKKTQELWSSKFLKYEETKDISGCRQFQGEDLAQESREAFQKRKQKEWLDEQVREKRERAQKEKEQDRIDYLRMLKINEIRADLESRHFQQKQQNHDTNKLQNFKSSVQLKEKLNEVQQNKLQEQQKDLKQLIEAGQKRQFTDSLRIQFNYNEYQIQ